MSSVTQAVYIYKYENVGIISPGLYIGKASYSFTAVP